MAIVCPLILALIFKILPVSLLGLLGLLPVTVVTKLVREEVPSVESSITRSSPRRGIISFDSLPPSISQSGRAKRLRDSAICQRHARPHPRAACRAVRAVRAVVGKVVGRLRTVHYVAIVMKFVPQPADQFHYLTGRGIPGVDEA